MANTNILREFLVKLGYKIDGGSERRFVDSVSKMSTRVVGLSLAATAAAVGVTAAVAKIADGLDSLYFQSKRTHASAENIRAFGYAMGQMGSSVESAGASLESVARFIRNNPGGEGWLKSIGIETRDANGNLRDTVEIIKDLGSVFARMDLAHANAYASFLGIDERTMLALREGMGEFSGEYGDMLRRIGLDQNAAAKQSNEFMTQLRMLTAEMQIFVQRAAMPVMAAIQAVIEWFRQLDPDLQNALSMIIGLTVAWKALSLTLLASPIGLVLALGAALVALWDDWRTFKEGGKSLFDWGAIEPEIAAAIRAFKTMSEWLEKAWGWWDKFVTSKLSGTAFFQGIGQSVAKVLAFMGNTDAKAALAANGAPGTTVAPKAPTNPKQAALAFFRASGWSHAQAAGIVANLTAESNLNPGAVGDNGKAYGIAQWHPDRQAAFKAWAGKDIREAGLDEQLRFVQFELTRGAEQKAGAMLRAAQNADAAGRAVSLYYERPLAAEAEANRRGASAVQISQETNITVHGSSDPGETGRQVASQQGGVNQQLVRNLRPVVQ